MAVSVVMPALEMAQETGKLISWLKREGEPVRKGEMLLEVEQRHVEQVHRLVQARIDLHLLLELRALGQAGLHALPAGAPPNRDRSRAVSVGPR